MICDIGSTKFMGFEISDVVIGLDCQAVFEALNKVSEWTRYRVLLTHINLLWSLFISCVFETKSTRASSIAWAISSNVTRDRHFKSYQVFRIQLSYVIKFLENKFVTSFDPCWCFFLISRFIVGFDQNKIK